MANIHKRAEFIVVPIRERSRTSLAERIDLVEQGVVLDVDSPLKYRWQQLQEPAIYNGRRSRQMEIFDGNGAPKILKAAGIIGD